jgi:tetratricopeptide (TPR) repeat protein
VVISLFLLVTSFLVFTCPPALTTGDSGEFITDAFTLSIAHPPGYPLYCLVGKAFSLLGLSNPGWRVIFCSIIFSALASVLLYLLLKELTRNKFVSFSSALVFASLRLSWAQSLIAKVYTLNVFFVVLCLILLVLWNERKNIRHLYVFSLVFGLSLTNHYPLMLLCLPAFLVIILKNIKLLRPRECLNALFFLCLGLTVYLYLPIRAALNPPSNWGNPHTMKGFLDHVFRQQYKLLELTRQVTAADKIGFAANFGRELWAQFGIFLAPMLFGAVVFYKENRLYFASFITLFLLNCAGLIFVLHFNYNPERVSIVNAYYAPSYLIGCVFLAFGLKHIAGRGLLFKLLTLVVIGYNFSLAWADNMERNNFLAYDYGKNVVSYLKKDSTVFIQQAGDESLFSTLFVNKVLGKRPDLKIYDCFGNVFDNIYPAGFTLIKEKDEWLKARRSVEKGIIDTTGAPVYYYTFSDEENITGLKWEKQGLAYEVKRSKEQKDDPSLNSKMWQLYNLRGTYDSRYKEYQEREIVGLYYYLSGAYDKAYHDGYDVNWIVNNIGLYNLRQGNLDKADKIFQSLLKIYPDYASGYYNLALVYRGEHNPQKAVDYFEKYHSLNPADPDAEKQIADIYFFEAADLYKQKKLSEAIETWKKVIAARPDYNLAYYNAGLALIDLKNLPEARKYLQKYVELENNTERATQVRSFLKSLPSN